MEKVNRSKERLKKFIMEDAIEEASRFDPTLLKFITNHEGLNVYLDGSTYYCKGVVSLNAEKMFNHYMENDNIDLMNELNSILKSAILGTASPTTSPTITKNTPSTAYTTWTVSIPFMKQRVYAYTREGHSGTTVNGQKYFIIKNTSIQDPLDLGYFSYQVFNYNQKAVLIQQTDNLCFVYVCYNDPDTYIPEYLINWALVLYVPYFVKKMYRSCDTMTNLTEDPRLKGISDTLQSSIEKGFVL